MVHFDLSTAYHPKQKVKQRGSVGVWRPITSQKPKQWCFWLPLAEWCSNSTYHTTIQISPFQALYGPLTLLFRLASVTLD